MLCIAKKQTVWYGAKCWLNNGDYTDYLCIVHPRLKHKLIY